MYEMKMERCNSIELLTANCYVHTCIYITLHGSSCLEGLMIMVTVRIA